MYVVNTFRTSKGPPKFCIDLGADWLFILDEAGGKSPGMLLGIPNKKQNILQKFVEIDCKMTSQ